MKRDQETYLLDLREACEHIAAFLAGMDTDGYEENLMVRRAVEREFEIIGEILRRIRDEMPELYAKIPNAKEIIGFSIISHGYDVVSDQTVYDIAKFDIPEFLEKINML